MSTIITRRNDGLPMYFCPKVGRDAGSGGNAWSSDPKEALRFARPQDAKEFALTYIPKEEPFCTYAPFEGGED